MEITEDKQQFDFPNDWNPLPCELDDWAYYRRQYSRYFNKVNPICGNCNGVILCASCNHKNTFGVKAMDIAAIDSSRIAWLIEIKDYRFHQRTKAIDLADEIAIKVRDSLAMILAAVTQANIASEQTMAKAISRAKKICVVAHIEQSLSPTRLRPRAIDLIAMRDKLRQLLHFLDPHVLVVESSRMQNLPWTVSRID